MLYLKKIELSDKLEVLDYIKVLVIYGSQLDGIWHSDCSTYEEMYDNLKKHENIPFTDYFQTETPCFQYLLKKDKKLVGVVSIRPHLTKKLDDTYGGNIGYSIRPSERRKGYATFGLKLAVEGFRKLNPNDKIIVCCYKDNIRSRKAIIKNGGKLIEEKQGVIPHQKYQI